MEFNVETKKLIEMVVTLVKEAGFDQTHPAYERWGKDGVFHITFGEFYLELCGCDNRNFPPGVSVFSMKGGMLSDESGKSDFKDGKSLMECIEWHFPK